MIHSTQNYIPWSSLSITSEDYSSCESNMTHTPPATPLYYKPITSDLCVLDSPPLSPEQYTLSQQQQYRHQFQFQQHSYCPGQQQEESQQPQQLQLLNSIPPSINIKLSDYGLCLDTNFTDIARLRNYLLSFVMDLPSPSDSTTSTTHSSPLSSSSSTFSGQLVSRNKRYRNKPVNLFKRFYELGQLYINGVGGSTAIIPIFFQQLILRQQTVVACIHTYFDCWVRYFPVFPRQQVLAILDQPRGLDSVIVNSIACFVLKHMLAHHHYPPALESIRRDPAKIRDLEEFFFTAAKHTLEQLLFDDDNDDDDYHRSSNDTDHNKTKISRFDIMGMLLMSYKVDMKKKSIYMAMAVQSLQSLQIHPGDDTDDTGNDSAGASSSGDDTGNDTESLWKAELDTRLWWMTWMNDFAVASSGSSTNMPSASYCPHDDILKSRTASASLSTFSASSSPSPSSSISENQQQSYENQHQQQQYRRRRVPKLWPFDCDGASEFGIMVNEHCLSIWRMQAEIIQHHYNSVTAENNDDRLPFSSDGSVVDFSLLDRFDTQLDRFLEQLPVELQSNLPYDATPISLVRARVHLELNATRIILHKLYIPDDVDDDGDYTGDVTGMDSAMLGMMDSSSLQWRSLNICLQSALDQVKIFHHCVMEYPSVLRCGFDRDELWRAAEIISVAVDFLASVARRYNTIDQQHIEQQILQHVGTKDTLLHALHQSLTFVQNTYEVQQCNNSNFKQLEDWLKDRINYHNKSAPTSYPPQHTVQAEQQHQSTQQNHQHQDRQISPLSSTFSLSSAPSPHPRRQRPLTKKRKSSSSTSASSSSSSTFDQQISFATGPCVFTSTKPGIKHNNNTIFGFSSPSSQAPSKTRFRYFSPKQNRGLLFIDENPVNG